MADLMQSIQDMLKEETWTRATISNYTQNNLKELADLVEKAKNEGIIKEVHEACQEHLSHSKDSIIALYICGILDLQIQNLIKGLAGRTFFFISDGSDISHIITENVHTILLVEHSCISCI